MSRIISHTDFDGLICTFLACKVFNCKPDEVITAEPKDIQNGMVSTNNAIVLDLPEPKSALLWVDHHVTATPKKTPDFQHYFDPHGKSASRVFFNAFKDKLLEYEEAVIAADRIDSADYTLESFKKHDAYSKISLSLKGKKNDDMKYFIYVLDLCLKLGFKKASKDYTVRTRYIEKKYMLEAWKNLIDDYLICDKNVIIVDLRKATEILPKGNIMALFESYPEANSSIMISRDTRNNMCTIAVSENPFFKGRNLVHMGKLMEKFGGGGHKGVGGCEIHLCESNKVFNEILTALKENKQNE